MSVLCKKIQKMNIQAYQHPLDLEVEFTLKKKIPSLSKLPTTRCKKTGKIRNYTVYN